MQYQANNTEDNTSEIDQYSFVNYVKTLQGECKKMKDKDEACILVYDSKMITEKEQENFKEIVKDIPNCFLVDYEDFVAKIDHNQIYDKPEKVRVFATNESQEKDITPTKNTQWDFIEDINKSIQDNIKTQNFDPNLCRRSIGNLVDCMRMLLLLHPSKLKSLAIGSNKEKSELLLNPSDFSLLYHDFDMIQKTDEINTSYGNLIDDKKTSLMFWRVSDDCGLENGLILVNSLNDRNADIENIILHYINNNISMYDCCRKLFSENKEKLEDFCPWFDDEHHCSWKINDKKVQSLTTPTQDIKNSKQNDNEELVKSNTKPIIIHEQDIKQEKETEKTKEIKDENEIKDEKEIKDENEIKDLIGNDEIDKPLLTNTSTDINKKNTNKNMKTTKQHRLSFKNTREQNDTQKQKETNIMKEYLSSRKYLHKYNQQKEKCVKSNLNRLGYGINPGLYNPNNFS